MSFPRRQLEAEVAAMADRRRLRLAQTRSRINDASAALGLAPMTPASAPPAQPEQGIDKVATDNGKQRGPRRGPILTVIALALVLGWAGVFTLHLVRAADQVHSGVATIQGAKASLSVSGALDTATVAKIDRASQAFAKAHADLQGPLIGVANWVPVLGTQVESVRALAGAAHSACDSGRQALVQLRAVLATHPQDGPGRIQMLRRVSQISETARQALSRVYLGPSGPLLAPISRRRSQLSTDLNRVDDALGNVAVTAKTVSDLLGGSHQYLLLAANNAEMRAGSGMFLEAGPLTIDHGQMTLGGMQPTGDLALPVGAVEPQGDFAARWGWLEPGSEWRNLATSPRFAVSAQLAARMWQVRTGQAVDGVMVVDTKALAALLAGTGPVNVDGTTLDAADAVQFLLQGQYQGALGDPAATGRIDALDTLAHLALGNLTGANLDVVPMAADLARASSGRHVLLWTADPSTEAAWVHLGVAGRIGPDAMALSVENTGGNKLDPYLSVTSHLDHQGAGGRTNFTLRVQIDNHTPPNLPPYVAGPAAGTDEMRGDYLGLVAVNLPGNAHDVRVPGQPKLPVAGRDGPTSVVAAAVRVAVGGRATMVVTFSLPGQHGHAEVMPSARIPPTTWTVGRGERFTDENAHLMTW